MIVIYTQDETIIKNDAEDAKSVLISIYGEKLGTEAYKAMKYAPIGSSYRKNGGPLVRVISNDQATVVKEKEESIGMM